MRIAQLVWDLILLHFIINNITQFLSQKVIFFYFNIFTKES